MRRRDREMSEEFALTIVDKCQWATLAMIDTKGMPYCLPITIVREDNHIYFHSAEEGEKVEILKENPNVCLSCVGDTNIPLDDFTTEFESAVVRGNVLKVLDDEEKILALKLLCQRHTPTNMGEFQAAIEKSLFRTAVYSIEIKSITGKRKKLED